MEQDKIFNLQLVIQKLEEELKLYRNGTTSTEFIEIIGEKDSENKLLKESLDDSNEKLRKLAKSSSEVITRFEALENDKNLLTANIKTLEENLEHCKQQIADKNQEIRLLTIERKDLTSSIANLTDSNKSISADLVNRDETIEKLQLRCASLVAEKSEKTRLLEAEKVEKSKQVKEIRDEYERAMKVNTDLKAIIMKDRAQNSEISSKLKSSILNVTSLTSQLDTLRQINENLEKQKEENNKKFEEQTMSLRRDCKEANLQIESFRQLISEQNEQLSMLKTKTENAIKERDNVINEHVSKIAQLETVIKYHTQKSADELKEKDKIWKDIVVSLENRLSDARLKNSPSIIKDNSIVEKRQPDIENRKNQQSMVRPLKDRSNFRKI